ncbi:recombinase family protein [Heliobacterium chlorum]|uniref:Recombinase family protein n=1 Tax=Heliobacterium chlorum TaxID=2698 RepID=A0ABR7T1D3_HELCL|nr:recombinase family protein [Heliobacterium chlorum]MBC9783803.1 recombinase family protein [Heliobacterium chlorum]
MIIDQYDKNKVEEKDLLKITVICYARVSTDEQAERYSLSSQIDNMTDFCKRKFGVSEDEILVVAESGKSGDDPNRPALNWLLDLMEKGIGRHLVTLHPNRLSRDSYLQSQIFHRVWVLGGQVHFVEIDFDPDNPESMLLMTVQGSIAQYNKSKILEDSKRGKRQMVKAGKVPGIRKVFGYTFDKEKDILIENKEEKKIYLLMVNCVLNDMSVSKIGRYLAKSGIPAPYGNVWYHSSIQRILKSEIYTGKFNFFKTSTIQSQGIKKIVENPENEWLSVSIPKYIDEQVWQEVQRKLSKKSKPNSTEKMYSLLRGLVKCGRCGGAAIIKRYSKNTKSEQRTLIGYYTCCNSGKKNYVVGSGYIHKKCKGRSWRVDEIDKLIWELVQNILNYPEEYTKQIDIPNLIDLDKKIDDFVIQIQEKQKKVDELLDAYVSSQIMTLTELDNRLNNSESVIQALKISLNDFRVKRDRYKLINQQIVIVLEDIRVHLDQNDTDINLKRTAIEKIVKSITLQEKSIEVDLNNLIGYELNIKKVFVDLYVKPTIANNVEDIINMYEIEFFTMQQICERTGLSKVKIRDILIKNSIHIRSKTEVWELKRKKDFPIIEDLYLNKGFSLKRIYNEYGYSPDYVKAVLKLKS